MKKIINGALIGITIAICILYAGARTEGAPILTYVYSDSMEPLIKVNDAFIIWPSSSYEVGDIITYRPAVLDAGYITHRIVGIGDGGFITKGDNSPYEDQEGGEPEVPSERIAGRVVTVNGQPLTIPGLGSFTSAVRAKLGMYTKYMAWLFLVLGILTIITAGRQSRKRTRYKKRLRLRHVYRIITLTAAAATIVGIYMGSGVKRIRYLVSEYPGSMDDRVEVNKTGALELKIINGGIIPVWSVIDGISPLSTKEAPSYLRPRSSAEVILDVHPHRITGVYHGYVRIYYYPVLLPRSLVAYAHSISPFWAIAAEGIAAGIVFIIFFKIIDHIHGFEGWIPLYAIRDKIAARRLRLIKTHILGRRRSR